MKDQFGKNLLFDRLPARIVSVVPSQTELLHHLGLDAEVLGITKFCVHPEKWFRSKQRVGGTKNINIDLVRSLKPDLVIANKEENTQADIEALQQFCKVGVTDIHNFEQALQMISDLGAVTGKNSEAAQLVKQLTQERELCRSKEQQQRSTLYLIWKDPYMAAGTDTFIHDMMMMAGFKNVVSLSRYPLIHADELIALNPEVVILSSEPYPFSEKHVAEIQQLLPQSKILLADGELFSWYGSRLLRSFAYFSALHEQIH